MSLIRTFEKERKNLEFSESNLNFWTEKKKLEKKHCYYYWRFSIFKWEGVRAESNKREKINWKIWEKKEVLLKMEATNIS